MGRTIPEDTVDKAVRLFIIGVFHYHHRQWRFCSSRNFMEGVWLRRYGALPPPFFRSGQRLCDLRDFRWDNPELSSSGRLVLCILMFVGRVGPLFLISAIAKKTGRRRLVRGREHHGRLTLPVFYI